MHSPLVVVAVFVSVSVSVVVSVSVSGVVSESVVVVPVPVSQGTAPAGLRRAHGRNGFRVHQVCTWADPTEPAETAGPVALAARLASAWPGFVQPVLASLEAASLPAVLAVDSAP